MSTLQTTNLKHPDAAGNQITFTSGGDTQTTGKILLGTTDAGEAGADDLTVAAPLDAGITIRSGSSSAGNLFFSDGTSGTDQYDGFVNYRHNERALRFGAGASEGFRLDSGGRLLVGGNTQLEDSVALQLKTTYNASGNRQKLSLLHTQFTAEAAGTIEFNRSRDNFGGDSAVINGSRLGQITFRGYDGADYRVGASINGVAAGTVATGDLPGAIAFSTVTAGGSLTEKARITAEGQIVQGLTSVTVTNTDCKGQFSRGSSNAGNYFAFGRTNRHGNGTNKLLTFHHGYWAGPQEVGAVGFETTSSTGGSGHGYGHFVVYTGEGGNGDSGSTSTERLRVSSGGKLTVPGAYSGTTTGGSTLRVESDGDILRYTSSRKYKTDIEDLEDARADAILNCRPVWYRSTSQNDIKDEALGKSTWGWYGFIAEEVAEIDPRLVDWATKDAFADEKGKVSSVERDPSAYEAESVRYDNFAPLLLNLIKRQKATIDALEARVANLEAQ